MPSFTVTFTYRGIEGQKSYWDEVSEILLRKGGRIIRVHSKVAKIGDPVTSVNTVSITYEAPMEIKLHRN